MGTYLQVKIETQAPVILTANRSNLLTATAKEFSGGVLRGIMVRQWLAQPGHSADSADFEAFFFGGLRFLPARPVAAGMRTYFLPRSLQQSKDKTEYADLLAGGDPDPQHQKGFKGKKGLGAIVPAVKADALPGIAEPAVRHHIRMHIQRGGRDDRGGLRRLAGRSTGGGIFNYESLDAGQVFLGEIQGPEVLLQAFRASLPAAFTCRIGRSHQTQYGKCHVEVVPQASTLPDLGAASSVCLRLETPLVTDGMALAAMDILQTYVVQPLREELERQQGEHRQFAVTDIYGAQQTLAGFNSQWGMKRPDALALAEGTVFRLQTADGSAFGEAAVQALARLAHDGVGVRVEEGFGQLRLWQPGQFQRHTPADQQTEPLASRQFAPETQRIAARILARRLQERARLQAWQDAENLTKSAADLPRLTHCFARLENLLGTRQHPAEVPDHFRQAVAMACAEADGETGSSKLFAKRLKELQFQHQSGRTMSLRKAIAGDTPLYTLTDFLAQPEAGATGTLADFATHVLPGWEDDPVLCGNVYYAYWLAFLRHARKQASHTEEGGEADG